MPVTPTDLLSVHGSLFKVDLLANLFTAAELSRTGVRRIRTAGGFSTESMLQQMKDLGLTYDLGKLDKWLRRIGDALEGKSFSGSDGQANIYVLHGPDQKVMLLVFAAKVLATAGSQDWRSGQHAQSMIKGKDWAQAKQAWLKVTYPVTAWQSAAKPGHA